MKVRAGPGGVLQMPELPCIGLAVIALALPLAVAAQAPAHAAPLEFEAHVTLKRQGLGGLLANPFAPLRAAPATVAARAARGAPAAPVAPVAPPVPLRYVGRIIDAGDTAVFVAPNDELFLAAPGATLGGLYRVQEIAPESVTLVYLPLGIRQVVPIPARD